jgi:hypothetical protein
VEGVCDGNCEGSILGGEVLRACVGCRILSWIEQEEEYSAIGQMRMVETR